MFSGIVEEIGEVVSLRKTPDGGGARLAVRGPRAVSDAALGDSIAVSGICLTVVEISGDTFAAELMAETLTRTTAGGWRPGSRVNLERSVTPATRLSGHIVQGHVDGVAVVASLAEQPAYTDVAITVPAELGRYIAEKGAVAVDGVSLTVINVTDSPRRPAGAEAQDRATTFTLGLIPTTRAATTLGALQVGDRVNIETDVLAKYTQRLLQSAPPAGAGEREADRTELKWRM